MWASSRLNLALRLNLRKARLAWRGFWRGRPGLAYFTLWAFALALYLAGGLQPVAATSPATSDATATFSQALSEPNLSADLQIPSLGLTSAVATVYPDNTGLTTPDHIVGSYTAPSGTILLIGHTPGVFTSLTGLNPGDTIVLDGQTYVVQSSETLPKSAINMRALLSSSPASAATTSNSSPIPNSTTSDASSSNSTQKLILMTCAGEHYKNGDASARLIVTALKAS